MTGLRNLRKRRMMHSMKYQPKELVITKFSRGAESLETVLKNRGGKKTQNDTSGSGLSSSRTFLRLF